MKKQSNLQKLIRKELNSIIPAFAVRLALGANVELMNDK